MNSSPLLFPDTFSGRPSSSFQKQVTGNPSGYGYKVNDVEFDNFINGKLLDSKGWGTAKYLANEGSGKLEKLIDQANRQVRAAPNTPIKWIVAEEKAKKILLKAFDDIPELRRIEIDVVEMDWHAFRGG